MSAAILLAGLILHAQETPPENHRKGEFTATLTEHHPKSAPPEMCKRVGWNLADVRKADPGIDAWKLAGSPSK